MFSNVSCNMYEIQTLFLIFLLNASFTLVCLISYRESFLFCWFGLLQFLLCAVNFHSFILSFNLTQISLFSSLTSWLGGLHVVVFIKLQCVLEKMKILKLLEAGFFSYVHKIKFTCLVYISHNHTKLSILSVSNWGGLLKSHTYNLMCISDIS